MISPQKNAALLIVVTFIVAGCAVQSDPISAASSGEDQSLPVPTNSNDIPEEALRTPSAPKSEAVALVSWQLTLTTKGGIAAFNRELTLDSSGMLQARDRKREIEAEGQLSASEQNTIETLINESGFFDLPMEQLPRCTDCIEYQLSIDAGDRANIVTLNSLSLASSPLNPLIQALQEHEGQLLEQ